VTPPLWLDEGPPALPDLSVCRVRPGDAPFLNIELRLGVDSVYDFGATKGRALPYGGLGVRF
jgi:hypothetical protein